MKTLVLDASVAAKWFLPKAGEPLSDEALALAERYSAGQLRFLVPEFFWAELGNIFWKAVRQGRWPSSDAEAALRAAINRDIRSLPTRTLLEDAFPIALSFDRSVYDALYVAAAIGARSDLVTADERLARALAAHFPVKWLGAFSL